MKNSIFLLVLVCATFSAVAQTNAIIKDNKSSLFSQIGCKAVTVQNKIASVFNQLFFGDPDSEAVYFSAGSNDQGNLAYILDVHNQDIRSEGMSYGMMIAVQMDKKDVFDALWNFAKTYMYHSKADHPAYGYFGWSVNTDGKFNDEMPAPDGEEYFATALYFASKRWGNADGIFNYQKEADHLTTQMIERDVITGVAGSRVVTGVSLFDLTHKMVRFTTDSTNASHTDASYHLPAFYEVWALLGPEQHRFFWRAAAEVSRDYFEKAAHPMTGLTSDYGNFDGTPWRADWKPNSATFSYDAWRTGMNWSMDWHWWQKDERAIKRSNRILSFFLQEGVGHYGNEYTLEGEKLSDQLSAGLVACNATIALAADLENKLDFVRALWEIETPTGQYRYYDGMLMMMALLHCSGEFKAYL